ncbi:glycogen debranching protein GlgX [Flavihumibacter profundi]|uniref:glycogen debranching protein GlgX n=1 Tax=Flavihumibacter profundi TaxID=2716883 RepID=UPI001CC65DBA|nr:glycogen debranching protein GlgX [Flavihumibacter profundi]MBZ5859370.1 glycogen debranching protein GlgX [Flavihumibacter profundi]
MLRKESNGRYDQPDARGESYPLGSTVYPGGVNFSIFCRNGTAVDLLFFDHQEDLNPSREISLNSTNNRTYHYWHIFVKGVKPGQLYGYRIRGPHEPSKGQWYDPGKILLDPYAKAVAVPRGYNRVALAGPGKVNCPSLKSVVVDYSGYDWEGDKHLRQPFSQTVIYELHVGGFTRHPSANVGESKRGTFAGLVEKIPYLVDLGINAVELLPVFQFDAQDAPEGLVNYWGYSPISFFAPHQGYSSSGNPQDVLNEFRDMVKALHAAGIEVILDVVYNHTAEGGNSGPTFSYRGIDNSVYYLLEKDDCSYLNFSGCGNTINANQSIVRRMILDSLHFWVTEMHVDGFRFDLASILSRDENGEPLQNAPILWDIESDPVLAGVKLIAEAWDAAGLYQVGIFIGDSWKEWNGKFRDDVRRFLRGDEGTLSHMVTRLIGSPDMYGHEEREPEQSINFVTCHDGFTLNDLVTYNQKHNEQNKEGNRDGNNENLSWNCGVEGETDDPAISALRKRQIRNFFAITLLSIGAPMIGMGDEVRRTQHGNNNAYCQDNETSWFDWNLAQKHGDIFRFVKFLIQSRLQRDMALLPFSMSLNQLLKSAEIRWHGVRLNQPDWSDNSHTISFTVGSMSGETKTHYLVNAFNESLVFELPVLDADKHWRRWIDTSLESPNDICLWNQASPVESREYHVPAHTIVVLVNVP